MHSNMLSNAEPPVVQQKFNFTMPKAAKGEASAGLDVEITVEVVSGDPELAVALEDGSQLQRESIGVERLQLSSEVAAPGSAVLVGVHSSSAKARYVLTIEAYPAVDSVVDKHAQVPRLCFLIFICAVSVTANAFGGADACSSDCLMLAAVRAWRCWQLLRRLAVAHH